MAYELFPVSLRTSGQRAAVGKLSLFRLGGFGPEGGCYVTLFFGQSRLHSCTTFLSFIFLVFEEKFGGLKILQPPEPLRLLSLFVEFTGERKETW